MILKINKSNKIIAVDSTLDEIVQNTLRIRGPKCDLNFIDTSRVTRMSLLFSFTDFVGDISEWDVSNVTDMFGMFNNSKFSGDISKWNTGNVKSMSCMFENSEFNGTIGGWDVRNVTDMSRMFNRNFIFSDDSIENWKLNRNCSTRKTFSNNSALVKLPSWYQP